MYEIGDRVDEVLTVVDDDQSAVRLQLVDWHIFYGDPADAPRIGAQFVRDHRASPSPHIAAHVRETAAWLALLDGEPARATADLQFALRSYEALANPGCTCHTLEAFAWWLATRDEHDQAAAVLTAVARIRERVHHHRAVYESVLRTRRWTVGSTGARGRAADGGHLGVRRAGPLVGCPVSTS